MKFAIIFKQSKLFVAIITTEQQTIQFFQDSKFSDSSIFPDSEFRENSVIERFERERIPFYVTDSFTEYWHFSHDMKFEGPIKDKWDKGWFIFDPLPLPTTKDHYVISAEWKAKQHRRQYSQEVAGKEYHAWLEERAAFYNNGFYEAFLKLPRYNCDPTVESVSEFLSPRLYSFRREFVDNYDYGCSFGHCTFHPYGKEWGFIIKKSNSFLVSGEGWEECGGSDGLSDYKIRKKFATLEEALAFLKKRGAEIEKL